MALSVGTVDKKGAWIQFQGELIGQGKDAARKTLAEKPELAKKIQEATLAKRLAELTAAAASNGPAAPAAGR